MAFYVGQKVVCVEAIGPLRVGQSYTVESLCNEADVLGLVLKGVKMLPLTHCFRATRFKSADIAIEAVAERADFGPAYNGEAYVTMTFRVPKDTGAVPGIWDLTPRCPGWPDWAVQKHPVEDQ